MTMVPAQSLSNQVVKQHQQQQQRWQGGYGSCAEENFGLMNRLQGYDHHFYNCVLEYSGLDEDVANYCNPMAEDESRTNSTSLNNNNNNNNNNEAGSSSKDVQDEKDERWLQLSIGGLTSSTSHGDRRESSARNKNDDEDLDHDQHGHHQEDPISSARRGGLVELDLLPAGGSSSNQAARPLFSSPPNFHLPHQEFRAHHPRPVMNIPGGAASFSTSLFFQHHPGLGSSSSSYPPPHHLHHHPDINWAFRPTVNLPPYSIAMAHSSPSSSSTLTPLGSYFSGPLHQVHSTTGIDVAGPSSDFRVIDPPRRPQAGIWFMLQASQNQSKEPFLPQISKSYLRIKDGGMTVRLIMKYLVNKLKLDSESEVEITCRGQQLQPFLTLQHVRDNIWSPRAAVTLLPESSTTDHVMVLHYGRRSA